MYGRREACQIDAEVQKAVQLVGKVRVILEGLHPLLVDDATASAVEPPQRVLLPQPRPPRVHVERAGDVSSASSGSSSRSSS